MRLSTSTLCSAVCIHSSATFVKNILHHCEIFASWCGATTISVAGCCHRWANHVLPVSSSFFSLPFRSKSSKFASHLIPTNFMTPNRTYLQLINLIIFLNNFLLLFQNVPPQLFDLLHQFFLHIPFMFQLLHQFLNQLLQLILHTHSEIPTYTVSLPLVSQRHVDDILISVTGTVEFGGLMLALT